MMERTDLELIGLVKDYGQSLAVAGIDLKIAAGSYCCLLGPLSQQTVTGNRRCRAYPMPECDFIGKQVDTGQIK
jgi:hypothetical protein